MDVDELRELEESLWRAETRFDRDYMERVLHPDFAVHAVAPGVALVTYVSEVGDGGALLRRNRASLWLRHDGRWRLRFHQGTAIPD